MNIALVLQHKLLVGIQRLLSDLTFPEACRQPVLFRETPPSRTQGQRLGTTVLAANAQMGTTCQPRPKVMPLRVLRVVEKGQPLSSTGRLVISGRMADVCAELDRLAARESALH